MTRGAEIVLRAAALLVSVAMFLPAAVTGWRGGDPGAVAGAARTRYFHGGKSTVPVTADAGCVSPNCHRSGAHARGGPESAFLNMHEGFVRCLACHGKEPERRWRPESPPGQGTGFRLSYAAPRGAADPHADRGEAARCPRCHSPEGKEALASSGVKGLSERFASPVVMRMMEGAGRKWVPQDLR